MSLFDWYEPRPALECAHCGTVLSEWQGKDGDCALFVWRQGERHPVDQQVDDDIKLLPADLRRFVLPEQFVIYTDCCDPGFGVWAVCTGTEGLWTGTRLMVPGDVDEFFYQEPKDRRDARRAWLEQVRP